MKKHSFLIVVFLFGSLLCQSCSESLPEPSKYSNTNENYLVSCQSDCKKAEKAIKESGGSITSRYVNFNILGVSFPNKNITKLDALSEFKFVKDNLIDQPKPFEKQNLHFKESNQLTAVLNQNNLTPKNYAFKNLLNRSVNLHQKNILGDGVIVAIIDSGVANNAEVVPALAGSVIGGENFVESEADISATSTLNDEHGTWVASMVAAHAALVIEKTHELAQAISRYAPESVFPVDDVQVEIPMVGTAPNAQIYALKTFGVLSPGAPSSRIIAAMDRVLSLKLNYNNGIPSEPIDGDGSENNPFVYDSLDIKVLNMSLGGPALFPGSEIEDIISDKLLEAGVLVVTSSGNEGFSAITGGSPGTAYSALTVGAASEPVHERILRELQLGVDMGELFRPLDNMVVASFSSRGPTADGRISIDMLTNGVATFVQGADGHISLVSGTSFSAPSVAGGAALLWQAFPDKSANQIRSSLILGADKNVIGDISKPIDQGAGYLNLEAAFELLSEDDDELDIPIGPTEDSETNVIEVISDMGFDVFSAEDNEIERAYLLKPGQVEHLFIESTELTSAFQFELEQITPLLPPDAQNQLTGDDIIISLVDAPTSIDHSLVRDVFNAPTNLLIENPQPGLLRLAIMGSWTNKGDVLVEVELERTRSPQLMPVANGSISDKQVIEYLFDVTADISQFNLKLDWDFNWSTIPAHDIDLIIIDPLGNLFFDAATLHSPETISFDTPEIGQWTVVVDGFLLHDFTDEYRLTAFDQNNTLIFPAP